MPSEVRRWDAQYLFAISPESNRWRNLDALRIFASIAILLHHSYEFLIPHALRSSITAQAHGLAMFVDLFFCISGFTICSIYREKTGSLNQYIRFILRRISRLLPLHWLTFFVSFAIWSVFIWAGAGGDNAPSLHGSCLVRTFFLLHGIWPCRALNGVSWSISAELVAYALYPVIFIVMTSNKVLARIVVALAFAVAGVTLWKFDANAWTNLPAVGRALPSFAFGVLIYNEVDVISKLKQYVPRYAAIFALLVFMCFHGPALIILILCYARAKSDQLAS